MDISIDYGNTFVIDVPRSYLTLVSGTQYTLDSDQFRLDLKDLEDDEIGEAFPDTHRHVPADTIAGATDSKKIIILSPYSVRFEDGQYTVVVQGSNNNIHDVGAGILVQNQVQVIPSNSFGLVTVSSSSGLSIEQENKINEIYKYLGLDSSDPMEHTPTRSKSDSLDIDVTRSGDGSSLSRLERQ